MTPASIQTRRDLARFLQAQMVASRLPWTPAASPDEDEGEGASGRTQVKTYLLEAHAHEGPTAEPLEFLRSIGSLLGLTVSETKDGDLFRLEHSNGDDFWCDTSMGRFWRLYTTADVERTDRLRDELVAASPWLDNVWLPPSVLENLPQQTRTELQTFSLSHDRRPLHRADTPMPDVDYVSMRVWASRAAETLAKLRRHEVFPRAVSIRSVRVRADADSGSEEFCVSEYFHHGKVTTTGNSFDVHTQLVVQVVTFYRALVERIESVFGLGYGSDRQGLIGNPIHIPVEWTSGDIEYAVSRMFSAAHPFRLWGLPEKVADSHYRARAVDLHVGQTFTVDVTPSYVTIHLPRGTCGNTVIRFLAALQFHVNSETGKTLLQ